MLVDTSAPTVSSSIALSESIDKSVRHEISVKTALVHEWLSSYAGSEKVTEAIFNLLENSHVFCTVDFIHAGDRKKMFGNKVPSTTFVQKLPKARGYFRYYLPLFAFAVRQHDLTGHELIISSSHAFAQGVKKKKHQLHICYSHTPMRYIWDMMDLYLEANGLSKGPLSWVARFGAHLMRKWDRRVSKNVDHYIANSAFTADRIRRCYGRKATVIYPPVDISGFQLETNKEDYYVTASRLVCYKKVDVIVEAFINMPDKKLIVIGEGKRKEQIEKIATPNITHMSYLEFDELHKYMRNAKAFVFAGEEDFGITMVEAQACGTPVIAYNSGGASEIVINNETGVLFDEQTPTSLMGAVQTFESRETPFNYEKIKANSERFSAERFDTEFSKFVNEKIGETKQ